MRMKTLSFLVACLALTVNLMSQTPFQNDKYGFKGLVPDDWHIYTEIKDNPSGKTALIDWGLPNVYSELEKSSIENSIVITAHKRAAIKSLDDLVAFEFRRLGSSVVSREVIDSLPYLSYKIHTYRKKLHYTTKAEFVFRDSIGYILHYTATPGTYDINLPKFNEFVKNVQFFTPKAPQSKPLANPDLRLDGLYIAKTTEATKENNTMEIYNYLRFYDDGYVYAQSVNSYAPEKVVEWFGRGGTFERKGTYTITGSTISFTVNNDEDPNKRLEGPATDAYVGTIADKQRLLLDLTFQGSKSKKFEFQFVKVE